MDARKPGGSWLGFRGRENSEAMCTAMLPATLFLVKLRHTSWPPATTNNNLDLVPGLHALLIRRMSLALSGFSC